MSKSKGAQDSKAGVDLAKKMDSRYFCGQSEGVMSKRFSEQFKKQEAVQLVSAERPIRQVSKLFGHWVLHTG